VIRSCTPLENAISIVPPVPARAAHAGGSGATETAANSTSLCCRGALTAPNEPVRACRRQTVSKLGCTSCRRATSTTLAKSAWLSSTIRSFSTVDHRRRRSGPDRTETLLTFAHLLANQSANYRRQSCRPEGGPHRRVTLLWDKVQFIVPYRGYRPGYEDKEVAKAIEIIGEQHFPTGAQKRKAHEYVEDFVTRPLPPTFLFKAPVGGPNEFEFRIFEDKLFHDTWYLLEQANLVGKPLRDFGVPVNQLCGLSLMSILADCCAGATHARVTDRGAAYANVVGLLGGNSQQLVREPAQIHEQLVPISLRIVNTDDPDLGSLIAFREREARSGGHAIRDLRHRYVQALQKYVDDVIKFGEHKSDRAEILRQFEQDMEDDLALLHDELRFEKRGAIFTKDMLVAAVAGVAFAAAPHLPIPPDVSGAVAAVGAPLAGIFGGLSVLNKYQRSRKAILQAHPMAYMYELGHFHA
jgi:hypothetical protein